MWEENITNFMQVETDALIEWAKCGESLWSLVPTVLWTVGTAALAHRMLTAIFQRFLFRRIPLWELVLQHLLFLWMVIYSLHFWALFVKILKVFVDYCYYDSVLASVSPSLDSFIKDLVFQEQIQAVEDASRKLMQQWLIWMFGVLPLAFYIHTRPRAERLLPMIWITTIPRQRLEMGAYYYYLTRPVSSLHSTTTTSRREQAMSARRAFSDSKVANEPPKKKRYSKSV